MPTEEFVNSLVINKVDTMETLRALKESGKLGEDDVYYVQEVITPQAIGAAPAGQGFGDIGAYLDDFNKATGNAQYRLKSDTLNGPELIPDWMYGRAWSAYRDGTYYQYVDAFGSRAFRMYHTDGTSTPWEYENPPFKLDVEYRTTERIANKVVFKKNINGVIHYRLEGEETWNPYSDAVGAAPAGFGQGTKQDGEKAFFSANCSSGWYRIATANHAFASAIMRVATAYDSTTASEVVCLVHAYSESGGIDCLRHKGAGVTTPNISDVRCVKTSDGKYAIDVYQRKSGNVYWMIDFINTGSTTGVIENAAFVIQTPTHVSADDTLPAGETLVHSMAWLNPPFASNTEYRTTERIGGKVVYKRNNGGVIEYRLDGETEWKPYAEVVGAVKHEYYRGDMNALVEDGHYRVLTPEINLNLPSGARHGHAIVAHASGSDTVSQLAIGDNYAAFRTTASSQSDGTFTWNEWKELATTGYAVNKAGDNTLTGRNTVETTYPAMNFKTTKNNSYAQVGQTSSGISYLYNYDADGKYNAIYINPATSENGLSFVHNTTGNSADTTYYDIYHEGNKPTADDIGAMPYKRGTATLAADSTGWYRLFTFTGRSHNNMALVMLGNNYYNNNLYPQGISAIVSLNTYQPSIIILSSSEKKVFSKLRIVNVGSNQMALEAYYSATNQNTVYATAIGLCKDATFTATANNFSVSGSAAADVKVEQVINTIASGNVLTQMPTAADVGAAPAGFGLGTSVVKAPTTDVSGDANAIKGTGFYTAINNTAFDDYGWSYIIHVQSGTNDWTQVCWHPSRDLGVKIRECKSGTIGEWKSFLSVAGGGVPKVDITDTTPTSATTYYPLYADAKSGVATVRANKDLYYYDTGSASYLNVGASDQYGGLTLHDANGKYVNVVTSTSLTANRALTLPDVTGTVYTTAGGTMDGGITMSGEYNFTGKMLRKKSDGGTWAYTPFRIVDQDNKMFANVGVYGTATDLIYTFIGDGAYDSANNLKIYPDGKVTIKNKEALHTGNKNLITPADIGASATGHKHAAGDITSGTLAVARGGTGQTTITPAVGTAGLRAISAGTTDLTAGTSSLTTGAIYFVYE